MAKSKFLRGAIIAALFVPFFAGAAPVEKSPAALDTPGTTRTLNLPAAAGNSPVIFLGEAIDPQSGMLVEGYAIIHWDKSAKGGNRVRPPKPPKEPVCYGFLAPGAIWKTTEPWLINPFTNPDLDPSLTQAIVETSIDKWESAAGRDILGDGLSTTNELVADEKAPDGQNEIYFARLQPGTIAVTIIWGTFRGLTAKRALVEWDQVYNTYYQWSTNGAADKMDFENIATHELGHSIGMDDVYDSACSAVTMYGYADYGETNKSTLEEADITGASILY